MPDNDCSNCDDLTCPFFGYSDNCYRNNLKDVKSEVSANDKVFFEEIVKRCSFLHKRTGNDDFKQILFYAQRIVDLINS